MLRNDPRIHPRPSAAGVQKTLTRPAFGHAHKIDVKRNIVILLGF
jgi:hypothetical protein